MGGLILGNGGVSDDILKLNNTVSSALTTVGTQESALTGEVSGPSGTTIKVAGTESIFNPFYVFRYSEFGAGTTANTTGSYDFKRHNLKYESSSTVIEKAKAAADQLARKQEAVVRNPTAVAIKTWADEQGSKGSEHKGPLYPYPYALTDFTQCKWYGKIPNNRLLTLRRYPVPIEDNLQVHQDKLPLVPIAQAVTWWGGETGNKLSELLGITYGFKWKPYPGEGQDMVQDITGNEITLEAALDTVGITNQTARQAIIAAFGNSDGGNPFSMSGYDKVLQQNLKDQYANGAYANRVLGPINVITQTQQRDRGYTFDHDIVLTFEYRLRAIGTVNPKIAMLDLISNFLSLTHNRASFWGGGYRYFQQTGPLLPGFNTDSMEKGDYADASKQIMSMLTSMIQGGGDDLRNFINNVKNDATAPTDFNEKISKIVKDFTGSRVGQNLIASKIGNLHQVPLVMRALADGRAVGEWHLMVGNPMDPLAVIGNLCLKSTKMEFSDELGADDFPVGIKFIVTLMHGRPRAKQDIESMFNHGGGDLSFSALQSPASANNSFGEYNNRRLINTVGTSPDIIDGEASKAAGKVQASMYASAVGNTNAVKDEQVVALFGKQFEANEKSSAENLSNYFKAGVSNKYGAGFGNSGILPDYFTKLYTKD